MSKVSAKEARQVSLEIAVSVLVGLLLALIASAPVMRRIDEMLVTCMSIVVAAAIPGVALTAAAHRPSADSPLEARNLGAALITQVRFWFSYLWAGGATVFVIIVGRALDWTLPAPIRPSWAPDWTPAGGYWIVAVALSGVIFTAIRAREIVKAVEALVQMATDAAAADAAQRARAEQRAVAAQFDHPETSDRGKEIKDRPRV
ncbi:MAG: hypothetical protein K2X61_11275 [Caulobacteraceae bacterium]|nr:hypothetical protein [Caulobacteraceae bacterium]